MLQKVNFDFRTIYWPGEDAPPQFEHEAFRQLNLICVPRYSDRVTHGNHTYFVYEVNHILETGEIFIIATRRVIHPPKERGE